MPEVSTDGRTVWVNGDDGMCLGRFGPTGIDVHENTEGQIAGKMCFDCVVGKMGLSDWRRFLHSMRIRHALDIGDKWRPVWLPSQ